jgi:hypothetical protein
MKMILNTGNKYDSVDIKELFPIETKDYIIKFFFFNEYYKLITKNTPSSIRGR